VASVVRKKREGKRDLEEQRTTGKKKKYNGFGGRTLERTRQPRNPLRKLEGAFSSGTGGAKKEKTLAEIKATFEK